MLTRWDGGTMSSSALEGELTEHRRGPPAFEHEALFYGDLGHFVVATAAFVEEGLAAAEPVMVALLPERTEPLRDRLGPDGRRVRFVDMAELGRNPARIIPAWRRFVDEHDGASTLRGIGEPLWADRGPDELTECQRHEALLNTAFDGGRPWRLLCPYDTASLAEDVLEEARRSHPHLLQQGRRRPSPSYDGAPAVFDGELPEPLVVTGDERFEAVSLRALRASVSRWASTVLPASLASDLVLAAHEMATNCIRHGGGSGRLRYWREGATAVVEVAAPGKFDEPLLGRVTPLPDDEGGRGLWLANQLCDLVQLRSSSNGTVVRLRMSP